MVNRTCLSFKRPRRTEGKGAQKWNQHVLHVDKGPSSLFLQRLRYKSRSVAYVVIVSQFIKVHPFRLTTTNSTKEVRFWRHCARRDCAKGKLSFGIYMAVLRRQR